MASGRWQAVQRRAALPVSERTPVFAFIDEFQDYRCREPQPVGGLVPDPADLAAQHRVLVPEHQEFGILDPSRCASTVRQLRRQRASR
jgi:hypothetical protein